MALIATHLIFLTREQRYKFINDKELEVTGVTIPVWVGEKTTEPAAEIFCTFKLKQEDGKPSFVEAKNNQYEITVPSLEWEPPPEVDYVELGAMSEKERQIDNQKRGIWWKYNQKPASIEDLRDITDGGSECLYFEVKRYGQIGQTQLALIHNVEIKTIESLESSIVN